MNIGAFPPNAPFLPALAAWWLAAPDPDGILLLPSRRAAQALAGAFLAQNQGRAQLLPRIIATGALDEAALAMAGALEVPPAIAPLARQAILARLICQTDAKMRPHAAWALAADLGVLLDEADYAEIDLAAALPGLVPAELASHWQTTLDFLQIVTQAWPNILAAEKKINPAARQMRLFDAQAEAWKARPPAHRIVLVARAANPALARLARVVAGLPNGFLLLPGYDFELSEAAWEALDEAHPQAGILGLISAIGARREEILHLPGTDGVASARPKLLSRALLPAACLADWQSGAKLDASGLCRLEAGDEEQNAMAIAMVLREALDVPGRTAALVTPDRLLAQRVAAALQRFGILADDSGGEKLLDTPPAVLLRLLARAVAEEFAPVAVLALLKHPLVAGGLPPEMFRNQARRLELFALRGPRPAPGLAGIKFRLDQKGDQASRDFLARLEILFEPLALPEGFSPVAGFAALLEVAEALAATPEVLGAAVLWAGEAGTALSELFLELFDVLGDLPDISAPELPALLDAVLAGAVVRKPRAKDGHPRIAIWGVQEAELQAVDVCVLGGLVEGVWPAEPDPGPWLSRPMRQAAGLPPAVAAIGLLAHDFFSLAASCGTVVLAAPARRERAPAVPARWLTRLDALLAGQGLALPIHPAAAWAAQLDVPVVRTLRPKPAPCPPVSLRPVKYSISDIATLLADPYAIYLKKILGVRELERLDEESDAILFGDIVHKGLAEFFAAAPAFSAPGAEARLTLALQTVMRAERPRAALENWWAARLERIAGWIVAAERERAAPLCRALEVTGTWEVDGFSIIGRADRIERLADGGVMILDYKTTTPPAAKQVETGSAPQLPLEAVLAEAGCFGPDFWAPVTELTYWRLIGRHAAGEQKPLFKRKPEVLRAVIEAARDKIPVTLARFALADTPYLANPHPSRRTFRDVYAGISRRAEWESVDDEED
jgi:ATP-dependent helicase/nuclease subunit B